MEENVGRLSDKVTIITGGAGGIGAATGLLFCEEGARVALVDSDRAAMDVTLADIRAKVPGAQVTGIIANVAREDAATNPAGNKALGEQMNALKGWAKCWPSLLTMWNHESGWRQNADNPGSSAYGIPQALPGRKMATAGADWQTNPATQIKWGLGYIKSIYGDPCKAWAFEEANGYY